MTASLRRDKAICILKGISMASFSRSPGNRSRRHAIQTAVVVFSLTVGVLFACQVPVFRYALERWRPDACGAAE